MYITYVNPLPHKGVLSVAKESTIYQDINSCNCLIKKHEWHKPSRKNWSDIKSINSNFYCKMIFSCSNKTRRTHEMATMVIYTEPWDSLVHILIKIYYWPIITNDLHISINSSYETNILTQKSYTNLLYAIIYMKWSHISSSLINNDWITIYKNESSYTLSYIQKHTYTHTHTYIYIFRMIMTMTYT